jgi:hypothetical protein
MNVLITYANRQYQNSQRINRISADRYCSFDRIHCLGPSALQSDFRSRNASLLRYPKGAGYWVWKPHVILETLRKMVAGDRLFYADSGTRFIRNAVELLDRFDTTDQDIIIFSTRHPEKLYTKLDAFRLMNCERALYTETPQRIASFIGFRRSDWSINFCEEWLRRCEDARIVTDTPNNDGRENLPGFLESKGDQSVLSLLSKQMNLTLFRDPSQYGNCQVDQFPNSPYPQILEQTWLVPEPRRWMRAVHRGLDTLDRISGRC